MGRWADGLGVQAGVVEAVAAFEGAGAEGANGAKGSLSRSVTSTRSARPAEMSEVQEPSGARQLQLPAATAGVFMRASEPNARRSCAGTRASSATDADEARIRAQTGLRATGPT